MLSYIFSKLLDSHQFARLFSAPAAYLRVPVNAISGPATRFHLVRVQSPELQLVLEQRAADVCRIVEFAGPARTNNDTRGYLERPNAIADRSRTIVTCSS